mmetsp:Transcript_733/g.1325  ORF Transcript_733/g.1325 Transcript_733/m.1325 type:complete len:488 (-) Transcript_733:165-1628(-)
MTTALKFAESFSIPCTDFRNTQEAEEWLAQGNQRTVRLQYCSSFRSVQGDLSCDAIGPSPNNPDSCWCDIIDLGVRIMAEEEAVPTCAPNQYTCEESRYWYFNRFEGCTNRDEIDRASCEFTVYDTREECCSTEFRGRECVSFDICPLAPTPAPTNTPTTSCDGRKWHFQVASGCTNSLISFNTLSISTMYDTVEDCCQQRFGNVNNCLITDTCRIPTPMPTTVAPTTCDERKWYFHAWDGCTNEEDNLPDFVVVYNTKNECCGARFGGLNGCASFDICTGVSEGGGGAENIPVPDCDERKFYFSDETFRCTNEASADIGDSTLYDNVVQCCTEEFGSIEECAVEDFCAPPTTPSPTRRRTSRPRPTSKPTKPSSGSDTPYPTSSETIIIDLIPKKTTAPVPMPPTVPESRPPSPTRTLTNPPTWGNTPTVGTDKTSSPVNHSRDDDSKSISNDDSDSNSNDLMKISFGGNRARRARRARGRVAGGN